MLIQLRRLGDLILNFPQMLVLQKKYPENPLWIVGRPEFFRELIPFAPKANFFKASALPELAKYNFKAIFNFGSDKSAANFCGIAKTEFFTGEKISHSQAHIDGFWQLYRAALTHNNRHNLFHWADLNRMDFSDPAEWPDHPLGKSPQTGRIGLFIGASEVSKRPDINFWTGLARRLLAQGYKPVLLGGASEAEAGQQISKEAKLPANFCGKTNLTQLAHILSGLDLLITPDTGPMHLADWLGTRVLNLSMGNVNAAETGPLSQGHMVVTSSLSCRGCWRCAKPRLYCHKAFSPAAISQISKALVSGRNLSEIAIPGLQIFQTGKDAQGFYILKAPEPQPGLARKSLDQFWKSFFLDLYYRNQASQENLTISSENLARRFPKLLKNTLSHIRTFPGILLGLIKKGEGLPENFWRKYPPNLRLLAGWLQMHLENNNYRRDIAAKCLEDMSSLAKTLANLA